jgi:hypothetical protein
MAEIGLVGRSRAQVVGAPLGQGVLPDGALVAAPAEVWSSVGARGAIDKNTFDAYYAQATSAAAIHVQEATPYPTPVPLAAIKPAPATPQSFSYLAGEALTQVRRLSGVRFAQLTKSTERVESDQVRQLAL